MEALQRELQQERTTARDLKDQMYALDETMRARQIQSNAMQANTATLSSQVDTGGCLFFKK